tara:strand:+ start:199 stop:537 length:339 start_codon:yes stop_codon:yes gene_type:complete
MSFDFSKVIARTNGTKKRGNSVMLLEFLKGKRGTTIGNHVIQTEAVMYMNKLYNKPVSPDTLSRLWRSLREEYNDDKTESMLFLNDISVKETKVENSIQKHYKIGYADDDRR